MTTVAVVTGSSSGVGAAVAARLTARGLGVVGVDVQPPAAASPSLVHVDGSVADPAVWTEVRERAQQELGASPEVLVFCAAVLHVGTVLDLTPEQWQHHYDVNVGGVFHGVRALLPAMLEAGRGSVTTVASTDAFMVEQGLAGYVSSKGALLQLTKAIAIDFARSGVRANCVAPGVIDTPFFRRHLSTARDPDRFVEVRQQRNPLGRFLQPDEVAATVEFVALDAEGMTGSMIPIDAGLSASFDYRTGDDGS